MDDLELDVVLLALYGVLRGGPHVELDRLKQTLGAIRISELELSIVEDHHETVLSEHDCLAFWVVLVAVPIYLHLVVFDRALV